MSTLAIFPNSNFTTNAVDHVTIPGSTGQWLLGYTDEDYSTNTPLNPYNNLIGLFPRNNVNNTLVGYYIKKIKIRCKAGNINIIKITNSVEPSNPIGEKVTWDPETEQLTLVETITVDSDGVNILELTHPFYVDSSTTRLGVMTGYGSNSNNLIYYGPIVDNQSEMLLYKDALTSTPSLLIKWKEEQWRICADYYYSSTI